MSSAHGRPRALRQALLAVLSAAAGLLIGYLLLNPLVPPPAPESLRFLLPVIRPIDDFSLHHGAWFVGAALFAFVAYLPNTLLLTGVAVLLRYRLARPRAFLYAVLLAPLGVHAGVWIQVWRMQRGAERLGLPTDLTSLPVEPLSAPQGLLMLLTYALFFGIVVACGRLPGRSRGDEAIAGRTQVLPP